MFYFKLFVLFSLSFCVFAEDEQQPANSSGIYTKSSESSVSRLNKAVDVLRDPKKILKKVVTGKTEELRDPTKMSPNFRQALKKIKPKENTQTSTQETKTIDIPVIELAGKVLTNAKQPKAMLRIDEQIYYIPEGSKVSLINKNQVITIEVEEVTKNHVNITVLPHNQQLTLQ